MTPELKQAAKAWINHRPYLDESDEDLAIAAWEAAIAYAGLGGTSPGPRHPSDGPEALKRAEKMKTLVEIVEDPWFTSAFKVNRIADRFGIGPPMGSGIEARGPTAPAPVGSKAQIDGMICKCGHQHNGHHPIRSVNYSAGKCKACDCVGFVIEMKADGYEDRSAEGAALRRSEDERFNRLMKNGPQPAPRSPESGV